MQSNTFAIPNMDLSDKQKDIVESPLESFITQACAGSGKTRTAVSRVIKLRELLGGKRTHVLLLSFNRDYMTLANPGWVC